MPFGAEVWTDGRVRFRIFAPDAVSVQLALGDEGELLPMPAQGDGWYELVSSSAGAGSRYRFQLPDGSQVPDPASRYQPEDVHGPSEVVDPTAFAWHDGAWKGRPWNEAVLYELHVGTFTPEGTFRSALTKLDHLAELGITAIELMSIADFAGNRNWGYDDVLLYAPDSAYGRPEDVKTFVEAAHGRGMMVILDVVYNHFGPEGNYITRYFHQVCSEKHSTPWGQALNFDGARCEQVRALILHNALYWIEEFHMDGLRLDASHRLVDDSTKHVLEELRERVYGLAGDRHVHLILEDEYNIARRLVREKDGEPADYTAQWNHDITHLLGGAMSTSCMAQEGDPLGETERLGKALAGGFVIAAEMNGTAASAPKVPPTAFVAFIQTHDLVGNRIFGDRIHASAPMAAVRAIAAIYLLSPQIPMLFMGEEWAASTPFPFFSDYHGELAEAVRKGRCEQLEKSEPKPSREELERAPNPQGEETFRSAQLKWDELTEAEHAGGSRWYQGVLRVRREAVVQLLAGLRETCSSYEVIAPGGLKVRWTLAGGAELSVAANLCGEPRGGFGEAAGRLIWLEGTDDGRGQLGSWSVRWDVKTDGNTREIC